MGSDPLEMGAFGSNSPFSGNFSDCFRRRMRMNVRESGKKGVIFPQESRCSEALLTRTACVQCRGSEMTDSLESTDSSRGGSGGRGGDIHSSLASVIGLLITRPFLNGAKRGQGEGGTNSFVACPNRLNSDHESFSMQGTVPTPDRDTCKNWAIITFFPLTPTKTVNKSQAILVSPSVATMCLLA